MYNMIIIDDEVVIGQSLKRLFEPHNFKVECFTSAEEFLNVGHSHPLCVYLIDSNLPGLKGADIVRTIRFRDKLSPVFMISGDGASEHISHGITAGADDYITKPFQPDVLVAKVINAHKKSCLVFEKILNIGIKLLPEVHAIMRDGVVVNLTSTEYRLFVSLLAIETKQKSRQELASELEYDQETERAIDVHVHGMRKKLRGIGISIETIRGYGYKVHV